MEFHHQTQIINPSIMNLLMLLSEIFLFIVKQRFIHIFIRTVTILRFQLFSKRYITIICYFFLIYSLLSQTCLFKVVQSIIKYPTMINIQEIQQQSCCGVCYTEFNKFANKPMIICKNSHILCKDCLDSITNYCDFVAFDCPFCRMKSQTQLVIDFKLLFPIKERFSQMILETKWLNQQVVALKDKNKKLQQENYSLSYSLCISQIKELFDDTSIPKLCQQNQSTLIIKKMKETIKSLDQRCNKMMDTMDQRAKINSNLLKNIQSKNVTICQLQKEVKQYRISYDNEIQRIQEEYESDIANVRSIYAQKLQITKRLLRQANRDRIRLERQVLKLQHEVYKASMNNLKQQFRRNLSIERNNMSLRVQNEKHKSSSENDFIFE